MTPAQRRALEAVREGRVEFRVWLRTPSEEVLAWRYFGAPDEREARDLVALGLAKRDGNSMERGRLVLTAAGREALR